MGCLSGHNWEKEIHLIDPSLLSFFNIDSKNDYQKAIRLFEDQNKSGFLLLFSFILKIHESVPNSLKNGANYKPWNSTKLFKFIKPGGIDAGKKMG
ncbi:MAG TPA: hypothetical protein ENH29_03830 [Bacteroidetes bacterium]|nr:hypothetical protein [Bacteroidota bacterium]